MKLDNLFFDGTDVAGTADAGDNIIFEEGTINAGTVSGASDVLGLEDIRVARLKDAEKNIALFKFPKE